MCGSRMLIVFGGDVGGGKSTHAKFLVYYFRKHGVKARYVHIKGFHALSRIFLVLLLIMRFRSTRILKLIRSYSPLRILYNHDRTLLSKVFGFVSLLNLIDVILVTLVRQYIGDLFNEILVVEDHVVGYANDMIYFLYIFKQERVDRVPGYRTWLLGLGILARALRKRCSLVLFLHTSYEELVARWLRRGTPMEYIEYLVAGRVAGRMVAKLGVETQFVDTSTSLAETFKRILGIVRRQLESVCE